MVMNVTVVRSGIAVGSAMIVATAMVEWSVIVEGSVAVASATAVRSMAAAWTMCGGGGGWQRYGVVVGCSGRNFDGAVVWVFGGWVFSILGVDS